MKLGLGAMTTLALQLWRNGLVTKETGLDVRNYSNFETTTIITSDLGLSKTGN